MAGRYYEDLAVGEVIVHEPSRTVTEYDNVLFCSMTMNPQPLHLDHEFARSTPHGKPVVNGIFTLALTLGLSVQQTTLGTTLGNLGFSTIEYPAAVFAGDTLTAETETIAKRVSASRPDAGIVEFEHRCRNQKGTIVLTCRRSGLMMRRPGVSGA